ncbi:MAG: hypothetical protein WA584_06850, partial [Pyrinomonadaceae bacterium]
VIYIPKYVKEEFGRKGKIKRRFYEFLQEYDSFLKICEIGNFIDVQLLYDKRSNPISRIDRGEAEVIIQARERGISEVLIDDRKGRNMAKAHTLNVKGTLGILKELKRNELIEKITPFLLRIGKTESKILKRLQVSSELFSNFLKDCDELEYFKNFINQ